MNNKPKIIKIQPKNTLYENFSWAASVGFSTSLDNNSPGFQYKIIPLSFSLCQKGNDNINYDKNKAFKYFVGDYVVGYCPYDNKKHEGIIKYFYWGDNSDGETPKLVYILEFDTELTIPLESKSIRKTYQKGYKKDYYFSPDVQLARSYNVTRYDTGIFEGFDFNSVEFDFNSVNESLSLNEQYSYLNEERVMSKRFFDENFKIKTRPGFHYKEYVDKTTGAYVTSVPSDDKPTGTMKFFAKHGISKVYNGFIGFSEKEQKWYGWSHRAIYGFGIGSKVKKGDCGYKGKAWTAKTLDDAKQMAKDFADAVS